MKHTQLPSSGYQHCSEVATAPHSGVFPGRLLSSEPRGCWIPGLVLLVFFAFAGSSPAFQEEREAARANDCIVFSDVTRESGIRWRNYAGQPDKLSILESLGSGGAWLDVDGDGDLDLYLITGSPDPSWSGSRLPTNALYLNLGNGHFSDATATSGLGDSGWGVGSCVGDVNNDGSPDLYVTKFGADRFYLNDGRGRFVERSVEAGLSNKEWGSSCAFADYDRDGDLDLYVVNYLVLDSGPPSGDCRWKGKIGRAHV